MISSTAEKPSAPGIQLYKVGRSRSLCTWGAWSEVILVSWLGAKWSVTVGNYTYMLLQKYRNQDGILIFPAKLYPGGSIGPDFSHSIWVDHGAQFDDVQMQGLADEAEMRTVWGQVSLKEQMAAISQWMEYYYPLEQLFVPRGDNEDEAQIQVTDDDQAIDQLISERET